MGTPESVDPELRFDTIWSNPPIRVGKEVLHEILLTWLPRLAPGGDAYLVVQKNLGSDSLQKWMDAQLDSCTPASLRCRAMRPRRASVFCRYTATRTKTSGAKSCAKSSGANCLKYKSGRCFLNVLSENIRRFSL